MTKPEPSSQASSEHVDKAAAFRRVFSENYDYVHHSLRRLGVGTRDLEDLAHDVFITVYESFDRYDPERPIRPWLFAFAFRKASDYRRLARHRTELGVTADDAPSSAPSAEELAARGQAAQLVQRALEMLTWEQRAVFILYEVDEVPMKEIAATLDIPLNTAYSRLRLARTAFADAVASLRGPSSRQPPGGTT